MLNLTNAKSLYAGSVEAQKLYVGSQLLWEKPAQGNTATISAQHSMKRSTQKYIAFRYQVFVDWSIPPENVTAIEYNGTKYSVISYYQNGTNWNSEVQFTIGGSNNFTLNGFETLTIYYT